VTPVAVASQGEAAAATATAGGEKRQRGDKGNKKSRDKRRGKR